MNLDQEVLEKQDLTKISLEQDKAAVSIRMDDQYLTHLEKERYQMLAQKLKVIEDLVMLLESNVTSLTKEHRDNLKIRLGSIVNNF